LTPRIWRIHARGGQASTFAQLGFKKRFRINTILIIESGCGIIWIFAKNLFEDVRAERAQPINTIFLKIELFTICLYQISDVGQVRPGRE